jgi:2-phosphosulfolactate phosphatase
LIHRNTPKLLEIVEQPANMPSPQLRVHKLPREVDEKDFVGSTVVVIDLLRATSTICQALASGAREVVPFLEIEDAFAAAKGLDRADIVLGGERRGGKIPGFDVGNSPAEYTPQVVGGKRVFITTTNGTRAMHHARLASRVVLGSFLNLSAVVKSIKGETSIDILCAGTDGGETGEDILAAGSIVHSLCHDESFSPLVTLSEAAAMAGAAWSAVNMKANHANRPVRDELALALRDTAGGRNLIGIGLDQDIVDCAQIDRYDVVPELDLKSWRIMAE